VTAAVGGSQREYLAEKLLVAAGRRPNTEAIGIDRAGVAALKIVAISRFKDPAKLSCCAE
jgi:pyruvate/2-oxoglutarate dehydrogenase complex dihydrolipoamide dehydrogenase (E3) component